MIRLVTVIAVFTALLAIAGCTATRPNYSYNAAASDPVLLFQSDFDYHTWFEINIDPDGANACKNFKSAGYTLHVDSRLIIGAKPDQEVQARVPAGRPVAVKAHYNFSSGLGNDSCGPIYVTFTPEQGKTYLVRVARGGERCTVFVTDTAKPNVPFPVMGMTACK